MQVEADLLRRVPVTERPTTIIVLGIGQLISVYELNNMASWPYDRNAIIVRSYADLPTVETQLSNAICGSKYLKGFNRTHFQKFVTPMSDDIKMSITALNVQFILECRRILANVTYTVYVVVRPSVFLSVCLSFVTFVHPTQAIEIFGNVYTPFNTLVI